MDQAVHTGNDLSKGAELGERYDLGLNNRTNLVVLLEDLPRIVLSLLVTQRNLLLLGIDVLDINLYFVANADNLRGNLILLQDSSEMWIIPSTPPRSTKAP